MQQQLNRLTLTIIYDQIIKVPNVRYNFFRNAGKNYFWTTIKTFLGWANKFWIEKSAHGHHILKFFFFFKYTLNQIVQIKNQIHNQVLDQIPSVAMIKYIQKSNLLFEAWLSEQNIC